MRGEGPPPYPLADGAQDHLLALAVDDALATGGTVTTAAAPWAGSSPGHGPSGRPVGRAVKGLQQ